MDTRQSRQWGGGLVVQWSNYQNSTSFLSLFVRMLAVRLVYLSPAPIRCLEKFHLEKYISLKAKTTGPWLAMLVKHLPSTRVMIIGSWD